MFERLLFGVENDQPIWGEILSVGAFSFFLKTPSGNFYGGWMHDIGNVLQNTAKNYNPNSIFLFTAEAYHLPHSDHMYISDFFD